MYFLIEGLEIDAVKASANIDENISRVLCKALRINELQQQS